MEFGGILGSLPLQPCDDHTKTDEYLQQKMGDLRSCLGGVAPLRYASGCSFALPPGSANFAETHAEQSQRRAYLHRRAGNGNGVQPAAKREHAPELPLHQRRVGADRQ